MTSTETHPAPEQTAPPPKPRAPQQQTSQFHDSPPPPPAVSHPVLAANATLAAASVADAVTVPWGWAVAAAVAGTGAATWAVNKVHEDPQVTGITALTGAAAGGYIAFSTAFGPFSPEALGVALLGLGVGWPLYWLSRWRTDKRNQKEIAQRDEERAEQKRHTWEIVLEKSGGKDIHVDRDVHDPDNGWDHGHRELPAAFSLALELGVDAPEASHIPSLVPRIEKNARNLIRPKPPIRAGSIQVRYRQYAEQIELVVPTKDILNEHLFIPDRRGPRSIADDINPGLQVDGLPLSINLLQDIHGMFSGLTGAGKSVFLNNHASELTRCIDNVTWMICGAKPVRNFAPWLTAFLEAQIDPRTGKPVEPVLDWVAGDIYEGVKMLLDLYLAIDIRQRQAKKMRADKWHPTKDTPHITLLIDESPDLLASEEKFTTHREEDGEITFSELLLKVARTARSEGIHLVWLTQRGTASMNGPDAGNLKSQVTYRVGMKNMGGIDTNAVFATETSGIDCSALPIGGLYMEKNGLARPVLGTGYDVPDDHIRDISIRHTEYAGPIDTTTAQGLNFYKERWTRRSQQEFLREIDPDARRTVPYTEHQPTATAERERIDVEHRLPEDQAEGTDWDAALGDWAEEFGTWVREHHPEFEGGGVPPEFYDEYRQHLMDTNPEVREGLKDYFTQQRQAEINRLEAQFAAPDAAKEPEISLDTPQEPEQAGQQIDPALPDDTRELLSIVAASDLLYSTDDLIPVADVRALAAESLGWEDTTAGGRKVSQALKAIDVYRVEPRPRINGRKADCYSARDLAEAVERHTITK